MSHTHGPWEIEGASSGKLIRIIRVEHDADDDGRHRAYVTPIAEISDTREEAENAYLIAAAPDLLALAKQYASECATCGGDGRELVTFNAETPEYADCSECADIRSVIAKAEGKQQ